MLISGRVVPPSRILERLEYLIDLVEHDSSLRTGSTNPNITEIVASGERYPETGCASDKAIHGRGSIKNIISEPEIRSGGSPPHDDHEFNQHSHSGSGQEILDWPIFGGKYDRRSIEALIFDPTLPCDNDHEPCTSPRVTDDSVRDKFEDPRQCAGIGVGIREDDVPHLVEVFLVNVHVKNPIFDPEYLRKMAKGVAEHGFDWKASSCLVVRNSL